MKNTICSWPSKPPIIITSLNTKYDIPSLKYTPPSATFFLESYNLCQGNCDRRNKSVPFFMPTVGNKVSKADIILKYAPPTWSKISHLQKIFIPSCKQCDIGSLFQTPKSPYLGRLQMPSQVSPNMFQVWGMWWKMHVLRRAILI